MKRFLAVLLLAGCVGKKPAVLKVQAMVAAPELHLVRSFTGQPASVGHRPRLGCSDTDQILVAQSQQLGGKMWEGKLEDVSGNVLERVPFKVEHDARFHEVRIASGHLLTRNGQKLEVDGQQLASGTWESYSGDASTVVAWKTCDKRPCPTSIFNRQDNGLWSQQDWPVETFGLALSVPSTGTALIASRENPKNTGWTLRTVVRKKLESGEVAELAAKTVWVPGKNVSLEDAAFVSGNSLPMLVGGASKPVGKNPDGTPSWQPSGSVYIAESGSTLREVLVAMKSVGNAEPGAAVMGGVLYVAAESADGRVGIWHWSGGAMVPGQQLQGAGPSMTVCDGALWASTDKGLWRSS